MKNSVDITIILDKSGSMSSIKNDTIGGFNSYIESQKKDKSDIKLTLVQFSTYSKTIYDAIDIQYVANLTNETFVPSGSTALLDCLGSEIDKAGKRFAAMKPKNCPDHVVFVIITDGEENASHTYTRENVFKMISHQKDIYKWDFIFLGAGQDAIQSARNIGIGFDKAMLFNANSIGTQTVYESLGKMTKGYTSGNLSATNFTQDDRIKAVK